MKIKLTKIKSNSFEGYVYSDELTEKQQNELKLDYNAEFTTELKISGDYHVEWDDDIPIPIIDNLMIENENDYIDLDLDEMGNELYKLEEDISNSSVASDWYADRMSSMIDQAYDDYREKEVFGDD